MSATLPVELDRESSEPLYRQIESFVRAAIDAGRLRPGQRIPSVRALAGQLGVGRLTVATAYEELAAEGYLVGRMGFGTIVAPHPPGPDDAASAAPPTIPQAGRSPIGIRSVRLPSLRALPPVSMPAHGRRPLETVPRYDLRSGGAGAVGGSHGALSVGSGFERLLREEWRTLAESGGSGATADPAGDPAPPGGDRRSPAGDARGRLRALPGRRSCPARSSGSGSRRASGWGRTGGRSSRIPATR